MHTAVKLRELIAYDPATGSLTWRPRAPGTWTSRYAGKECGTRTPAGYIRINVAGVNMQAHVVAWIIVTGSPPSGEVDHWDGDGGNNRWANLRDVSHGINQRNMPIKISNTTGYPGVHRSRGNRWFARIKVDRRTIGLGFFASFEEAKAARITAEQTHQFRTRT